MVNDLVYGIYMVGEIFFDVVCWWPAQFYEKTFYKVAILQEFVCKLYECVIFFEISMQEGPPLPQIVMKCYEIGTYHEYLNDT